MDTLLVWKSLSSMSIILYEICNSHLEWYINICFGLIFFRTFGSRSLNTFFTRTLHSLKKGSVSCEGLKKVGRINLIKPFRYNEVWEVYQCESLLLVISATFMGDVHVRYTLGFLYIQKKKTSIFNPPSCRWVRTEQYWISILHTIWKNYIFKQLTSNRKFFHTKTRINEFFFSITKMIGAAEMNRKIK